MEYLEEYKKIYNSMPKYYKNSIAEYKKYIQENCMFYLTRRKHTKNYILKKLLENGYEITEKTHEALKQISIACKIYGVDHNGKDFFETLLCGNEYIMKKYIYAMNVYYVAKKNQSLMPDVIKDLDKLSRTINERKRLQDKQFEKEIGTGR